MPPEGGDLFIDEGDDGVGALCDAGVGLVVCDPEPSVHACEDDGSTCSGPHTERSKFREPKRHWLGNIPMSTPTPSLGCEVLERVLWEDERVRHTQKEMLQTEQR